MYCPRAVYWDEELGRLVSPDEPAWDSVRFSERLTSGGEVAGDTIPAPPPVPEEHP